LDPSVVPAAVASSSAKITALADAYKQLDASFGDFAMTSLHLSTTGLASTSAKDKTYEQIELKLADIGAQRDALALEISQALEAAEFGGVPISTLTASMLLAKANGLISKIHELDASF